jgi:glycerophosphoryl diester phosphodiesterase
MNVDFLRGRFAHRGLHGRGRPENSRAAFQAAIELGVGIELDVQPSADGVAMAFHDDRLDRLTDRTGPIDALPADALAATPLRRGQEGIPRLSEALALIAGRVPLLIEIKDRDGDMGPAIGPLEGAVLAALEGYPGPVALMSFNPHSVAYLAARAPHIPRGLTTAAFDDYHWPHLSDAARARLREPNLDEARASFVSHDVSDLGSPVIGRLAERGVPILTWTIRSKAQEAEALRTARAVTFEGYLP